MLEGFSARTCVALREISSNDEERELCERDERRGRGFGFKETSELDRVGR